MSSIQKFDYNGTSIQRRDDGFVNLTQMCVANGKRLDNWLRLKGTQSYLVTLSNSLRSEVVYTEEGVNGGTWGHPSAAINLARWLSDNFAVWCDAHIFNLMATGQTSLEIDPVEEMRLKIELAKIESQKEQAIAAGKQAELSLTQFRHHVTTTLPEPVQQKILGFQVVEKKEIIERVVDVDGALVRSGETLNKTQLCRRYGLLTKNGKPDYRTLNKLLDSVELPSEAWELTASIQENRELRRGYLGALDRILLNSSQRQMWLGE